MCGRIPCPVLRTSSACRVQQDPVIPHSGAAGRCKESPYWEGLGGSGGRREASSRTDSTDQLTAYWRFHAAVSRAQLLAWLPPGRRLLIDLSGPRAESAALAAKAGHTVLRVLDQQPEQAGQPEQARQAGQAERPGRPAQHTGNGALGRIITLIGDPSRLSFLPDGCADGVIAGNRVLSLHLAAEQMVDGIARVLRPAGRVMACVDSLVLGMAAMAGQSRWPNLADLPNAEVVLVPWPDGSITRCYGPDQVRELFAGAGLSVNWVRPRTVLSQSTVNHLLAQDPAALPSLVRAELGVRLSTRTADDVTASQLVISACKP